MKKKFVKVMFFGALSLAVSTAVTSCKDYDDDIDNLQTQIDANKASIADLQKFVNEGKWVKGVESVTGGFKITFSDGQSYTVVNGKDGAKGETGATGAQGVAGKDGSIVTIGEDGFWYIDGKKTDVKAQGEKGEKGDKGETGAAGAQGAAGKDGYSPYIGEDGFWYFYNAETQKVEKSKYQANIVGSEKTYIVENPTMPKYTLHTVTKDGKEVALDLPTADNIQSVKAVTIAGTNNSVHEGTYVGIKYNKLTSAVQFKGLNKEWNLKAGDILSTATEKISAIINPSNVDATTYKFYLQDSKGANELFVLGAPKANETSTPLTRANTKNEGVYDFNISLKEGVTEAQLNEFTNNSAFALATKNAWGNTIISAYDIEMEVLQSSTVTVPTRVYNAEKLNVGKAYDLYELFKAAGLDFSNIVDYNFINEIPVSATVEGKMLTVNVPKSLRGEIKMECLAVDGTKHTVGLNANFYNASEAAEVATPIKWVVPSFGSKPEAYQAVSSVDALKAYLAEPSRYSIVYSDGTRLADATTLPASAFELAGPVVGTANGISLACAKNAKSGVWEMTAKFDPENIAPTTYTIHLGLRDDLAQGSVDKIVQTFDLTAEVVENAYAFEPTNYLDNGKARVYGTFVAGKVTFDLEHLYKNLDLPNTTFKQLETKGWNGDETWMTAGSNIITATANNKNVYKARNFEITYKPYGNDNFKEASQKFTVEILSEIHEGAHADFKNDKVFLSSNVRDVTIDPAKLGWTDYAGEKINLVSVGSTTRDSRLKAEPTLTVSHSELIKATWNSSHEIEVKLTAPSLVKEDLSVYVTVSVVDIWGITTTQKVMVPIKKAE